MKVRRTCQRIQRPGITDETGHVVEIAVNTEHQTYLKVVTDVCRSYFGRQVSHEELEIFIQGPSSRIFQQTVVVCFRLDNIGRRDRAWFCGGRVTIRRAGQRRLAVLGPSRRLFLARPRSFHGDDDRSTRMWRPREAEKWLGWTILGTLCAWCARS